MPRSGLPVLCLSVAVILIGSITTSRVANAQSDTSFSGRDFLTVCSRTDPGWIGFCRGYVQAVVDLLPNSGKRICAPRGLSREQIVTTVVRYLNAAKEFGGFNAASVVEAVMEREWPCR